MAPRDWNQENTSSADESGRIVSAGAVLGEAGEGIPIVVWKCGWMCTACVRTCYSATTTGSRTSRRRLSNSRAGVSGMASVEAVVVDELDAVISRGERGERAEVELCSCAREGATPVRRHPPNAVGRQQLTQAAASLEAVLDSPVFGREGRVQNVW